MKIASVLTIGLLLTSWASGQEHEYVSEYPVPGYLLIRKKTSPTWTEDRYIRMDKVTSVSLISMSVKEGGEPQCQVRIATLDVEGAGKMEPLVIHLPPQPKAEAEKKMFEIMRMVENYAK